MHDIIIDVPLDLEPIVTEMIVKWIEDNMPEWAEVNYLSYP